MISEKTLKALEYDKILKFVSDSATLLSSKELIKKTLPASTMLEAEVSLLKTKEAYNLIYNHNVSGVYFFEEAIDELLRVDKGGVLNNAELLKVASNLRSARIMKSSILSVFDESVKYLKEIATRLFTNQAFEEEISEKIISVDEISDNASEKLYSIRKSIRNLNSAIRDKLNSLLRGKDSKFLQDAVVTMRRDRYVIPVKSEYRSSVKGFIHDQSISGSTVFIEPEAVMELNNELKSAMLSEQAEIYRILSELSHKVSFMSDGIRYNLENLVEIDCYFARAIYAFETKSSFPELNDKGILDIKRGRHPLINREKVVPVSISLGSNYNFILLTGPNTGGKTVTMKMTGLFSLMAMSGFYVPAEEESKIPFFNNIFCDIGDEQSIENDLSTFSSHMKNIIEIVNNVDVNSLVLLDEIGAGTDPEEGSALALAIIEKLLDSNCFGIITTHYARLKEYAVVNGKIENASMEFDSQTLKPLYKLNVGIPGSSNAIEIAKTLGINDKIIDKAFSFLSKEQVSFENVLKKAEESRRDNDKLKEELVLIKEKQQSELQAISEEKNKIVKEREKIYFNARQETKRIVADKLQEAEEIIDELKSILKRAGLESKEVFRAGELRNRLKNSRYLTSDDSVEPFVLKSIDSKKARKGDKVYIKSLGVTGEIYSLKSNKSEVEVVIGSARSVVKLKDLYEAEPSKPVKEVKDSINVNRKIDFQPKTELNVVGKTSLETLTELKNFIDQAILYNLEEIKIIHGVGQGVLLKTVRNFLKTEKCVEEFRSGKYGEGENGVTIVKLK